MSESITPDSESHRIETDKNALAAFDITQIDAGDYYITAEHPEYATTTTEVYLDGTTREVTISLDPTGPPQQRPPRGWSGTIEALEDLIAALDTLKSQLGGRK
jgi:hypothetical protein